MDAVLLALPWVQPILAAPPDPEDVKPGGLALVIVLLMGLATYLLWRSMNRQLRKVHFDDGSTSADPGTEETEDGDQRG